MNRKERRANKNTYAYELAPVIKEYIDVTKKNLTKVADSLAINIVEDLEKHFSNYTIRIEETSKKVEELDDEKLEALLQETANSLYMKVADIYAIMYTQQQRLSNSTS